MADRRTVLHVLPHPGGGGETYIEALADMDGYRFERVYLARGVKPAGARVAILRRAIQILRSARAYDLLHVHGEVAGTLCLPALAVRPSVVTLHGLHLLRRLVGLRRNLAAANVRLIVRAASRTICVSEAEFKDLQGVLSAQALRRGIVIRNGVPLLTPATDDERAGARRELGIPDEAIVGAWVGSLDEHKDPLAPVRAAIEVARHGAPLKLLVAGEGPLRPQLESAIRESGTKTVHVLGFRRDVERILRAADFFVLSSLREGLSFSVLEAMSLGLPVVVSDAPGNPEVVDRAGIVVGRGNVAGFAAAFRCLLNERKRLALGEAARERVNLHFRQDEMVRRTRGVYDDLARTRHGR